MNREEDIVIALCDTSSKQLAEEYTLRRRGGRGLALRQVSDVRLERAIAVRWRDVLDHLPYRARA